VGDSPTLRYWRQLADRYVTALCHIPGLAERIEVDPPTPAECATWVLTAPPMRGGEYLTVQVLLDVWSALHQWTAEAIPSAGGLEGFLQARAPQWHQVGRSAFISRRTAGRASPVRVLATYATGFGAGGQLKHLPLRKALEHMPGRRTARLIKQLSPCRKPPRAATG
jgi:non-specific serine/threonine protein kinase